MATKYGFRRLTKRVFNINQWLGVELLKCGGKDIFKLYRKLTVIDQPKFNESFEEAVIRQQLTENDIQQKRRYFQMTSSIYGVLLLFGIVYAIYLTANYGYAIGFMGVVYCFLMFSFYFRESFWLMQINKRKLGMNFYDWMCYLVTIGN